MRDLEGDLSLLQRVVEFLPIEQLEKSHTVKAVSRAWRTAARRALTRGRWKPLRTLEDRGKREQWLTDWGPDLGETFRLNDPAAHSAFDRDAREAWALYPGEVLLLLLDCNTPVLNQYIDDFYRQGRVRPVAERVAQPLRGRKCSPRNQPRGAIGQGARHCPANPID